MFLDYIKVVNERKKINKKVEKRYIKLIISIVIGALGFLAPSIISQFPFLIDLLGKIDGLYMMISKTNEVITPLLYIGMAFFGSLFTVVNTIRLVIQKNRLRNIELEEKEKLLELKDMIEGLTNEKEEIKEQVVELNKSKKQILKDLKKTIIEKISIKKNANVNSIVNENEDVIVQEENKGKTKKK